MKKKSKLYQRPNCWPSVHGLDKKGRGGKVFEKETGREREEVPGFICT